MNAIFYLLTWTFVSCFLTGVTSGQSCEPSDITDDATNCDTDVKTLCCRWNSNTGTKELCCVDPGHCPAGYDEHTCVVPGCLSIGEFDTCDEQRFSSDMNLYTHGNYGQLPAGVNTVSRCCNNEVQGDQECCINVGGETKCIDGFTTQNCPVDEKNLGAKQSLTLNITKRIT